MAVDLVSVSDSLLLKLWNAMEISRFSQVKGKFSKQASNSQSRCSDKCRGVPTCLLIKWKNTKHAVSGILHCRSWLHLSLSHKSVTTNCWAMTDNVVLDTFIYLALFVYTWHLLTVSFLLNHLHRSQTRLWPNRWSFVENILHALLSEWNHGFFHLLFLSWFLQEWTI